MGSPCRLTFYAENAQQAQQAYDQATTEVYRLEQKYSRYRTDSITALINRSHGKKCTIDPETYGLLSFAGLVFKQSDGLFDITSGVLRRAWDFKKTKVPSRELVDEVLSLVGWHRVKLNQSSIVLPKGMELDFGGFVKEYAVDAAVKQLRQMGINQGVVDLGGDLFVLGPHSNEVAAHIPWQVGIRDPLVPRQRIRQVGVLQGAVATSGYYERYFELDGSRYCHILNPRTGWPVQGLASVTVFAGSCLIAGIASTVAMLKGQQQGLLWLQELGLAFICINEKQQIFESDNSIATNVNIADT